MTILLSVLKNRVLKVACLKIGIIGNERIDALDY
jgi:hypothetical protein